MFGLWFAKLSRSLVFFFFIEKEIMIFLKVHKMCNIRDYFT